MKNKLKGNLTIKIFSVLTAIFLWLYIQMVQNPDIEYTFPNMKVNFVNSALLEERNLVVMNDKIPTSSITVKCPRWNLNELKTEDFVAYVDLSEIKTTGNFDLSVKVRINNENIYASNKNPSSVSVTVDRIVTMEKDLVVHTSGKLKDGYYTNDKLVVPERTSFSVKGPQSIVEKIYNGVVSVDLANESKNFEGSYNVILVSEDGTAVSSDKITILDNKIGVSVTVYEKKIVPVIVNGISSKINYEIKPSNVEIAGPPEIIRALEKIEVDNFSLISSQVGFEQKINLNLSDELMLLNDAEPYLVIKE